MTIRYIVQRAATREVLTYDAPIVTHDSLNWQLNGAGSVELLIEPAVRRQVAADGLPMYGTWLTLISIEEDGQLRFRGIVKSMTWTGEQWKMRVPSITTYPYGQAYEGDAFYGAKVDPADVIRRVWAHVQSFADSDLAVRVVGKTPVRIGSFSTQNKADTLAAYNAAVKAYNTENAALKQLRDQATASNKAAGDLRDTRTTRNQQLNAAKKTKNPTAIAAAQTAYNAADAAVRAQEADYAAKRAAVDRQAAVVKDRKATKDAASAQKTAASKAAKDDGGAYTLLPWEAPDCGRTIDDVTTLAPLDWYERHYWEGDEPRTEIVVAYPRAGRRLSGDTDPTFEQGVNIMIPLEPEDDGDDYANAVYGVGAGEGPGSLRRSTAKRDGRLRRSKAFSDKSEKNAASMDRKLAVELNRTMQGLGVTKIVVVADHPNAKRGSYDVGDEIYIVGDVPNLGPFAAWHRITGITDKQNGTVELDVALASTFIYGKGLDDS